MASRTEKFAYRVELDGKSAADALDILGKKSKDLREQMKKMKEANDLAGFEKVERELRSVEREAKRYQQAMFDVQKVMNNLSGVTTRDLITTQRILSKQLKDELIPGTKEHTEALKKLGDVQKQIISNNAAIRNAGKEEGKGGSMFGKLAEGVNKYALVVGSAIFGISSLVSKTSEAVEAFNKFEQAKAELQSLTGVSMEARDEMGKFALELSTSTVEGGVRITKSAVDIVDAFKLVGSQAPELLKDSVALQQVTKDALILAEAAGGDVKENVKGLTTTMNMFDLVSGDTNKTIAESHRIINILAAGAQAGAGEIPYIQEAMEKAGTQAHMFGISVENTVGIIETLAPRISEASVAGTGLRGVLLRLESQTNNEFKPSVVGYTKAMENLAAANLTTAEQLRLVGEQGVTSLSIMVQNRKETENYTKAVTGSNKAVEQASINTDTNTAKLEQAKNVAEKHRIELGEKLAPVMLFIASASNLLTKALLGIFKVGEDDSLSKLTKRFEAQAEKVKILDEELEPLLATYDKLKTKGNLNVTEQEQLKEVIGKISKIMPDAVSSFDDLGGAMEINTAKARDLIEHMRRVKEILNKDIIKKHEEDRNKVMLEQLTIGRGIQYQKEQLLKMETEAAKLQGTKFYDNAKQAITAQRINISKLNDDWYKLNEMVKSYNATIDQLKGNVVVPPSNSIPSTNTNTGGHIETDEEKKAREEAEKLAKKALKDLESAREKIKSLNTEIEGSLREGIDKEIFLIHAKYQKLIDDAKEKQKTDIANKQAWIDVEQQLEAKRDEESLIAMQAFEKKKEEAAQKAIDDANKKRKDAHDKYLESLQDDYTKQYNALGNMLEAGTISYKEYLEGMEKLDKEHAARVKKEEVKKEKDDIKKWRDRTKWQDKTDKEKLDTVTQGIQAEMQITSELANLIRTNEQAELQRAGENEEKKKQIRKKYADIELKITTAEIIATTALKVIQAFPNPWLMGAAAVAGAIQEVNAIKQRDLVAGYEHGYYNVTRTDGMQYRAGISNDTSTQTVSKPTVFLAGEGGFPEMIIDGHTLRNLQINYPEAINAIHASRTMPGFANGSYATNTVVNNNTVKEVINAELVTVLQDFKAMMAQGIKANLVWRDLKEFEKKVDLLKTDFN